MVAAITLPAMAQHFGQQEQNSVSFQSTSTMPRSGSVYASQPAINENGFATYTSAESTSSAGAPAGPRKIVPVTPEGDPTPLGDALLPLMLMALAFGAVICLRQQRTPMN